MAFKMTYEPDIIPAGEYDVIVYGIPHEDATHGGKGFINITFKITSGPQMNNYINWKVWPKKEPNAQDNAIGGYNFRNIQNLAKAVGIPEGTEFNDLDDILRMTSGKPLKVTVSHNIYNGNTYLNVDRLDPANSLGINDAGLPF